MGRARSKLSKRNKYYISENRYKELLYFARQYAVMRLELADLRNAYPTQALVRVKQEHYDPMPDLVDRATRLADKIELIEECAYQADPDLWTWILTGVTTGKSYDYLSMHMNMPASKELYYDRYHKFFYLLSLRKD